MGRICLKKQQTKKKKCSQKVLTIFKIEDTIKANIFLGGINYDNNTSY